MGVPSFYRWLIEKYPMILQPVCEEEPTEINGVTIPVNTSKPNPNGIEYDNLYLDMNGIIHPCFHPENKAAPTTFTEVFERMFEYIDRLFVMVRPRKLLFFAIDGVAPRAKMNQQRSRRFKAAKDAAEVAVEEERLRQEFLSEGKRLTPKVVSEVFDSNIITPGTEFMATLSFALQYYIHVRLNSDPGWKNIKVILSDANVPGEGEHKIMSYIRLQKNHPGYNPNTRHCLYGLDADLIMLALATHEIHVSILREVVSFPGQQDKCFLCGQSGHRAADCEGKVKRKAGEMCDNDKTDDEVKGKYEFVNIWILREYLEKGMQSPDSRLQRDLDRIIDDFIFICFFVGNDFLPHMPTLDIHEGAIDLMMSVYKKEFGSTESYLSNGSKLDLKNVEQFIQAVGQYENNIFLKRAQLHQRQLERIRRDKAQPNRRHRYGQVAQPDSSPPRKFLRLSSDDSTGVANVETESSIKEEELDNNEELKFKLKKLMREKGDLFSSGTGKQDKIRLGEEGWRERYYEEKFTGTATLEEMEEVRKDVILKYTEGLCWVMHYYYHGVCSWKWFYPYHYAPFASDLKGLDKLDIKFELGSPFKPFNQLLAVLPSASAHALPECFRTLMTDPNSPIADFYPQDFEIDMNGKRFSWQGISKLPFIEEQRLLDAAAQVEHSLTKDEIRRNSVLFDLLFVAASYPLAELIRSLNSRINNLSSEERATVTEKIDPVLSEGMNGYIASCGEDSQLPRYNSPIEGMEDILANQVTCAIYKLPDDVRGSDIARPAAGVVLPKMTVQRADLKGGANVWHEDGERRRAPEKIVHVKRSNPEGSISGLRLGKVAHRLVLQTINGQPDDMPINSEPSLCPNTFFRNPQVSDEAPYLEIKISQSTQEDSVKRVDQEKVIVKKMKQKKMKERLLADTGTEEEKMLIEKEAQRLRNKRKHDRQKAAKARKRENRELGNTKPQTEEEKSLIKTISSESTQEDSVEKVDEEKVMTGKERHEEMVRKARHEKMIRKERNEEMLRKKTHEKMIRKERHEKMLAEVNSRSEEEKILIKREARRRRNERKLKDKEAITQAA